LRRRGALSCPAARAPGPAMDAVDKEELETLFFRLKRKLETAGFRSPNGI